MLAELTPTDESETRHPVEDVVPQAVLNMNCVLWTRGIEMTTSQQSSNADGQATPGAVPLQLCLQVQSSYA